MPDTPKRTPLAAVAAFLREPPRALEILLWLLLAGAIVAMRIYTWQLLPAYMWTRDSGSYSYSAYHWLDTGHMIFDGRRGPVYTTLIAIAVKVFGTMNGVVWLQHALGGLAILAVVLTARVGWGRVAVWPLFVCGACLASYGLVLQLGHLIRNETILFVLSAATLCAWWLSLKWNSRGWLFASALTLGIMILAKSVFAPFPLVLLGGVLFFEGHANREKIVRAVLILAGMAVPLLAVKIHNATSRHVSPPQPQAGILFYGRTAQWTKLDGGIEPELKAKIHDEVLDYRALPKLDNNIVIKRTIVPHLARELHAQGKTDVDLDHLCRRLAIEAVESQPAAWLQQIKKDLLTLHIHDGVKDEFPSADEIDHAIRDLQNREEAEPPHPVMQFDQTIATLQSHEDLDAYKLLRRLQTRSILFQFYPVLLTTIALVLLIPCTRGKEREFFCGLAILWFANMLLLSTVGRPVERYLMPLVPIMFWAMSGVLVVIWRALLRKTAVAAELPVVSPQGEGENSSSRLRHFPSWLFVATAVTLISTAFAAPLRAQAPQYSVTILSDVSSGLSPASIAAGLNNSGQVVGRSQTYGTGVNNAVVWNGTTPTILNSVGGAGYNTAWGINASGVVVGTSSTSGDSVLDAVVWSGTTPTILTSEGGNSGAYGINASGQIVGVSYTSLNLASATEDAVVWNGTTPTVLTSVGGTQSYASGINASGQIVGTSYTAGNALREAVVWNGTTPTALGSLGGSSEAFAINTSGQIAGYSDNSGDAVSNAVVWNGTTPTTLGTLGGTTSDALGINDSGQVVGDSFLTGNSQNDGFLYTGGTMYDLNSIVIPGSGVTDILVEGPGEINDAGQIAAIGTSNGKTVALLLTPTPEPASAALLLGGLVFLGSYFRRRA